MQKLEGEHKAGWVTISTDEDDSMRATIETLSNKEVMRQLRESETSGSKSLEKVKKALGIQ